MNSRELIGDEPPEQGPEFVVLAVERKGWFSHEAIIAARYAFTRTGWPPRQFRTPLARGVTPEFSASSGDTFRLLLPRRLARPGRLVGWEEVAGNPALAERWHGVAEQ